MSRVKTSVKKEAKIDISAFTLKRGVEIEKRDIEDWIKNIFVSQDKPEINLPPTMSVVGDSFVNNVIKDKTFKFEGGKIEFSANYDYPEFITSFAKKIKLLYNLKDEVSSFQMMVYPPRKKVGEDFVEYNIPRANKSIVISRIIFVVGHREVFNFTIPEMNNGASEIMYCNTLDSFSMPIGIAAGINIMFDNTTRFTKPSKKGFRPENLTKDCTKRFVCVLDFNANIEILTKYIKSEASKLSNGNKVLYRNLVDKFSSGLDIKNVNDKDVDEFIADEEEVEDIPIGKTEDIQIEV